MHEVFLLLGSNLGDRIKMLDLACMQIAQNVGIITNQSSVYETEPWGTEEPLPFLNKIIQVTTDLTPQHVLEITLRIEESLGRKRDLIRNQPRTIDIDIILYNDSVVETDSLTIPHARMHLRRFVLVPLSEIAALKVHPLLRKNVNELLSECKDGSWVRKFNG